MQKLTSEELQVQILKSYESLKFVPRGNQVEIVEGVLDAFLNKEKQNVVLNAGTGVGKSVLGAVIADALHVLTGSSDLQSIIAMGTNSLAKQYHESFDQLGEYRFFQIKGASNYPCAFMQSQPSAANLTADECVKTKLHETEVAKYCNTCEFNSAKKRVNTTDNLITNYSYFLTAALVSNHLKSRNLHVFDESHVLNEIFCSFTQIDISIEILDKYIKELSDTNGKCDTEAAALVMFKDKIRTNEIGENNYLQYIDVLGKVYKAIASTTMTQSILLGKEDMIRSAKYEKMSKKYAGLAGKIRDLTEYEYEHVFDNTVPNIVSIKTIFVNKIMGILLAPYNLFMSATITDTFAYETLGLEQEKTEFIQLPPVFPPENKPLFFIGKQSLNFNNLKDPDTIETMVDQIKLIVEHHSGEKGLIISPSFYLGSQMAYGIRRTTKVFEHKSGVNLSDLIMDFKKYKGPAILVSPSIFEGLDFKNDESRFQIILKAPYPSLGDKRIRYIADNHPNIYQEMTLLKILQGIGRSIRTPEDFAATYMLDAACKKLYNGKLNLWKDHYKVMN
jgi:ATP-dependent DNA helicase DinG